MKHDDFPSVFLSCVLCISWLKISRLESERRLRRRFHHVLKPLLLRVRLCQCGRHFRHGFQKGPTRLPPARRSRRFTARESEASKNRNVIVHRAFKRAEARAPFQRQRRDIFVEHPPTKNHKLRRSDIGNMPLPNGAWSLGELSDYKYASPGGLSFASRRLGAFRLHPISARQGPPGKCHPRSMAIRVCQDRRIQQRGRVSRSPPTPQFRVMVSCRLKTTRPTLVQAASSTGSQPSGAGAAPTCKTASAALVS